MFRGRHPCQPYLSGTVSRLRKKLISSEIKITKKKKGELARSFPQKVRGAEEGGVPGAHIISILKVEIMWDKTILLRGASWPQQTQTARTAARFY